MNCPQRFLLRLYQSIDKYNVNDIISGDQGQVFFGLQQYLPTVEM